MSLHELHVKLMAALKAVTVEARSTALRLHQFAGQNVTAGKHVQVGSSIQCTTTAWGQHYQAKCSHVVNKLQD